MRLSMTPSFKARLLMHSRPVRWMRFAWALLLLVLALHAAAVIAPLVGGSFPTLPYGLLFTPLAVAHLARWWALSRGWSAVCVNELTTTDLIFAAHGVDAADPPEQAPEPALPRPMEARLAELVQAQGWVSWAQVIQAARESGMAPVTPPIWLMIGGHRARVARRSDWRRALHPKAWQHACLRRGLPEATARGGGRPRL